MDAASGFTIEGLFQVNMPVKDIDRAVAFYGDVLGLPLHARREGLAFFSVGPVRLLVERVAEEGGRYGHPGSILYFKVADIAGAHAELVRRGVTSIEPPHMASTRGGIETWMAFFEDGEWNTHAVVAEVPVG